MHFQHIQFCDFLDAHMLISIVNLESDKVSEGSCVTYNILPSTMI